MVKMVQTQLTTVFRGDNKSVAAESSREKPENPDEILRKNTKKVQKIKEAK